jgi:hypothetical protein
VEYLNISDNEWPKMWDELADYNINEGDFLCINEGQCWEYMGSTPDHHHFRHACHPRTGSAEYFYLERARAAVAWA